MPIPNSYFDLHVDYATREIAVSGEFDVNTAPCLATAIAGFQNAGDGDITILLDDVTFIDAAGIGAVSQASVAQTDKGARLGVTGATSQVRRIFGLGNLTDLLHACSSAPAHGPPWVREPQRDRCEHACPTCGRFAVSTDGSSFKIFHRENCAWNNRPRPSLANS
jgi:anti-sigma B factor antagonist